MAVDFTQLLKKPAGLAKKPLPLPAGDYQGIIKSYEVGDNNKNKTPYIRFQIGLVGWPESVDDSEKADVDLSKRQLRKDFYYTDDALWRLDEFIKGMGIEPSGRGYDEIIPEMVGMSVTATVKQDLNQSTSEIFNQIDKLTPAA